MSLLEVDKFKLLSKIGSVLLLGWLAFTIASPSRAQTLQETQAAFPLVPRDSFTLAQLNHFFDAARMNMGVAVDSAKGWVQNGSGTTTRPATSAPAKGFQTPVVPPPMPTASYERTFRILLHHPEKTDQFDDLIQKYSERTGLDPRLIKAIIAAESEFHPTAKSPRGALGLMQLMPKTATMFVHLPWHGALANPELNIAAGVGYLLELFQAAWKRFKLKGVDYKNAPPWLIQRIIAAYNAGPKFLFRDHFYHQTRDYVRKVMRFYHSKVSEIRVKPLEPKLSLVAQAGTFY